MALSVDRWDPTLELDPSRVRRYLERIGVDPGSVTEASVASLTRVQQAHLTAVPFENLSIVGDPRSSHEGAGVTLDPEGLYEKIVERRRGGYCYELNGLFTRLLSSLGFVVDRLPARIVGADGDGLPPANHHAVAVDLDRRYLVDVGMGPPGLRRPVPIGGAVETGDARWRVIESDRPEVDHRLQFRRPADETWRDRYLVRDQPVDLGYFRATNDYLQAAEASPFTDGVIVTIATETGYLRATPAALEVLTPDGTLEHPLDPGEWHRVLAAYFGLVLPDTDGDGGTTSPSR